MDYWHGILTEKSWKVLQELKGRFDFILIGGWATYLWARTHKSKDIDIIVGFPVLSKLKREYDLGKNDNLKKYEISIDEIDVDIYVPFYSELALPLEKVEHEMIEGLKVAKLEYLLILKQAAEEERSHSEKGEKDRIDIISLLLNCDVNFKKYHALLEENGKAEYFKKLMQMVQNFMDYKYLNLSPRELKLKKRKILEDMKKV